MNRYNYTAETVGSPGVQVHTDSSFLTVLLEDDRIGGLEVADPDTAEFEPVDLPLPGSLLVNIGDIATVSLSPLSGCIPRRWPSRAELGRVVCCRRGATGSSTTRGTGCGRRHALHGGHVPAGAPGRCARRFRAFSYGEHRRARHSTLGRAGEALTQFAI
ncbi:hypothetical protein SEVIR_1G218951v4 [Setaria viridis]